VTPEEMLRQLCEEWRKYLHNPWGGTKRLEELFHRASQVVEGK
jgi:hypothetical protein